MSSKEQTPITADELYISIADVLGRHWEVDVENTEKCVQIAEQYAQYREKKAVLEALEREFKKVAFMLPDGIPLKGDINYITGEQHYETEVKPNYETSN